MIDNNKNNIRFLGEKFSTMETEFRSASITDDAITAFENYNPDLVLIDYSADRNFSNEIMFRILDLDATTCFIALIKDTDEDLVGAAYTNGARAVINVLGEIQDKFEAEEVIKQIYNTCSELSISECVACWKSSVFIDSFH